jgi:hypothetical protein
MPKWDSMLELIQLSVDLHAPDQGDCRRRRAKIRWRGWVDRFHRAAPRSNGCGSVQVHAAGRVRCAATG